MTTTTAMTRPTRTAISPVLDPMRAYLLANRDVISALIPERLRRAINAPMIIAQALAEIARPAKDLTLPLLKCEPETVLRSILLACELGLRPGSVFGEVYLIPYGKECTLQIGYKGLVRLVVESGALSEVFTEVVYAAEIASGRFRLSYSPAAVTHDPLLSGEKGEVAGAWAWGRLDGSSVSAPEWMDAATLRQIRAQAESKGASPAWKAWETEMQRKAVLKRYLKRIPVPVDALNVSRAIAADNGEGQRDLLLADLPSLTPEAVDAAARAADEARAQQERLAGRQRADASAGALEALTGEMSDDEKAAAVEQERQDEAHFAARVAAKKGPGAK